MTDQNNNASNPSDNADKAKTNLGGILDGLGNLLGKVSDLASNAENLQKLKDMQQSGDGNSGYTVHSSFNVRTLEDAAGGNSADPQPVHNPAPAQQKVDRAAVTETREPHVDIFEEDAEILIVAEMPGIDATDIRTSASGDVLTITAESGAKRFAAEVLLPTAINAESITISGANGVFEIRASRAADAA